MMNPFHWFALLYLSCCQAQSEAIIRRILRSLPYPAIKVEKCHWAVKAEPRDTYQVTLFLSAQGEKICYMATCGISIERDLIPRDLGIILLEENHRFEDGVFQLVPIDEKLQVVLARTVNARMFPRTQLKRLCTSLIDKMQRTVQKLYAMGVIISGPEPIGKRNRRG